jgi:hypothetical protein
MDQIVERWLPVVGWAGTYEVSDHGRVRSLPRIVVKQYAGGPRINHMKGQMLTLLPRDNGSGQVYTCVRVNGTSYVHRLVLEAFVGPCPDGMETRHLDGNPSNNCLSNLQWGTVGENTEDRGDHGNFTHGERNGQAVLTEADVAQIRSSPLSDKELAALYGVRYTTIYKIRTRQRWRHVA